ncbi:MAG: ATP-binding cassette domain-containing protein [Pseudomonadota bacterium]
MAPPLLTLQDIHLTFGGTPLLEGADLIVAPQDRVCLIGRNGSGKSTLLKIAASLIDADSGDRFVHPAATIRYLEQEPDLSAFSTLGAYAESGLAPGDDHHRVATLFDKLGLESDLAPANLSGGEIRRAALARALAPDPDILLLDEPTNHLDLPAIEWLEGELARTKSALVIISHDRRFLSRLSRRTVWIDRGETRAIDKGFSAFEEWRDTVLAEEEVERHKLDRKIARENHWVVHGVSGRRKRNQKRLKDLEGLRQEKRRLADRATRIGTAEAVLHESGPSGKMVLEAADLSKAFDGRPIVRDFSLTVRRKDRIGLVGPNGVGKTTLLNLLIGTLSPDAGSLRHGTGLDVVTLDQKREAIAPTTSLADALTDGRGDMVQVGKESRHVIGYMKDFMFLPEQARTPIGRLSGGERGRLMLARAFARPSNLLVLDEPTNDLDLETLDLLQELLDDYAGTVFLVSHDRDFLDRVVASVIVSRGHGAFETIVGGYSDAQTLLGGGTAPKQKSTGEAKRDAGNGSRPDPGSAAPSKRRLSFKENHALKTLPSEIAALEEKIERLNARLGAEDAYARDPEAFRKTGADLEKAQADLSEMEDEWLRLEVLREEIEAERAGARP